MSKYSFKKRYFTLIELLAAMAVFSIISLVMMRFFNSSQKVWSIASQRNILYSDARIALDLITRDLQCAMYNNDDSDKGIYPFWFEYKQAISSGDTYYPEGIFWTQLNFISATNVKDQYAASNISEIRYTFVPVGRTLNKNNGTADTFGGDNKGYLVRSCTGDCLSNGNANPKYNFLDNPYGDKNTNRVKIIFEDSSSDQYREVISSVYDFKITCYALNASGALKVIKSMDISGALKGGADTVEGFDLMTGTVFPVAVKIEIQMMAPTDWNTWLAALGDNDPRAEKIRRRKMRTFSKTVFLGKRESI